MGMHTNPARSDVINKDAIVDHAFTVGTSAVEAKVGGSRLDQRQEVFIYNTTNKTIYWSVTNALTTSTGVPIDPGEAIDLPFGEALPIYLIAGTAGNDITLMEFS